MIKVNSECLESSMGGKSMDLVPRCSIRYKVYLYWNKYFTHFGLYPVGDKRYLWAVTIYVMFPTGFVKSLLIFK